MYDSALDDGGRIAIASSKLMAAGGPAVKKREGDKVPNSYTETLSDDKNERVSSSISLLVTLFESLAARMQQPTPHDSSAERNPQRAWYAQSLSDSLQHAGTQVPVIHKNE